MKQALAMLMILLMTVSPKVKMNRRSSKVIVYDIYENDKTEYTVEDRRGDLWGFYAKSGDYEIGDRLLVIFDTMGTLDRYDDEIIRVYKLNK
jgi:hypothetical protein